MTEAFTFGIPLIAPEVAQSWDRVRLLFAGTLQSILRQSDRAFTLVLACHEAPAEWDIAAREDPRLVLLRADWKPVAPSSANDDGGGKKWLIRDFVRRRGGGLLMYVDGDDLVDSDTVLCARRSIGASECGGIVASGLAIDFETGQAAALPDPRLFGLEFHRVCGSSVIGRIGARDAFDELGWHSGWAEAAAGRGERLARLPLTGGYLVNTGESHSERHGPFSSWRREFARRVRRFGRELSERERLRLGMAADEPVAEVA